jgi:hypothetical protein
MEVLVCCPCSDVYMNFHVCVMFVCFSSKISSFGLVLGSDFVLYMFGV